MYARGLRGWDTLSRHTKAVIFFDVGFFSAEMLRTADGDALIEIDDATTPAPAPLAGH